MKSLPTPPSLNLHVRMHACATHPVRCQRPTLLLSGLHCMPSGRCHTRPVDVLHECTAV